MGLFDALKRGLSKTRDKLVSGLRTILPVGRKIDEELLDQLTDAMLSGDMGPRAVRGLIEEVRQGWKAGQIAEAQEILPFMKQRIAGTWSDSDRALHFAGQTCWTSGCHTELHGSNENFFFFDR